ncbi:MAG: aldehyde ferredoxin oxidoreductase C-terminal domain-containing protein [Dehalococcoidales bacterium]
MVNRSIEELTCPECGFVARNAKGLRKHLQLEHDMYQEKLHLPPEKPDCLITKLEENVMSGWSGKILRVDLSKKVSTTEPTAPYIPFVGGRGINVKIMFDEVGPEVAPFDPENRIIFGPGVLTGTPAPTGSRMKITTMCANGLIGSGGVGEALGAEIRFAGYDNIIVQGKLDKPGYIYINDDVVEFRDASHIWGKETGETRKAIKDEIGDQGVQVASIGQAGENMVSFACIKTGVFTTAGRGGMGAIMGSKNLKAVAVRGGQGIKVNNMEEFLKISLDIRTKVTDFPDFKAPIEYLERRVREMNVRATKEGVPAWGNWEDFDWDSVDPDNFVRGVHEYYRENQIARIGCFSCPVSRYRVCDDPEAGIGMALCNSLPMFAWRVWNRDFPVIETACHFCASYGLDTISTANIISFLMELYHRGIITAKDTDGIPMKRGDKEAILTAVHKIGKQEGFGKLFRDGILAGAKKIGRGAEEYAMQVKGMEIGLREIRGRKGTALATAVSPRLSEGEYPLFEQNWNVHKPHAEAVDPAVYEKKGRIILDSVRKYIVLDMIGMCRNIFLRAFEAAGGGVILPVKLLALATGEDYNLDNMFAAADKVHLLERAFDVMHGVRKKDDTLPKRLFESAVPGGPLKGARLDKKKFDEMLVEYYEMAGWDEDGVPKEETFKKLGLEAEWKSFNKRLKKKGAAND